MNKLNKLKHIENLNKRLLSEEQEPISGSEVRKGMMDKAKELQSGLSPKEREVFMKAVEMLGKFFQQSGNQAVGRVNTILGKLFNELGDVEGEPEE